MAAELIELFEDIKGDWQSRTRITVEELSGEDQLGLGWGIRCRHYSADATAALAYEAEALDPLDSAGGTAFAGASGGTVVQHSNLGTTWTPVLGTNMGGTAFLTQTGSYRAWARLRSPDGDAVKLRFVYDVGDLTLPEENAPWEFPAASQFYLADLGQIRLDKVPVGDHRWQGQIQAKGAVGGEDVQIDRLYFQPLDEGAGKLVAVPSAIGGLADYLARDEFNQTAGDLSGKTAAAGGNWSGAGDSTDFAVETTGKTAQRTATADADAYTGRFAWIGSSNYTDVVVHADSKRTSIALPTFLNNSVIRRGVVARYVDVNNWIMLTLQSIRDESLGSGLASLLETVRVTMRVGGTVTGLRAVTLDDNGGWYQTRLAIDADGRYQAWVAPRGATLGEPLLQGSHEELATGGALATGKAPIYDAYAIGTGAITRNFDSHFVTVPTLDAVLFANQSAELRTDGMFREDSGGVAYGPVSQVIGDLPRLPPSGMEGRPVELLVITSRGDLDQLPDTATDDDIGVQVAYRPSWLFAPSA